MEAQVDISAIKALAAEFGQIAGEAVDSGVKASSIVLQKQMKEVFGTEGGGVIGQTETGRNIYLGAPAGSVPSVRTGTLRRSIQRSNIEDHSIRVGTNKKYGYWLEYGTEHMAARPWLYKSLSMAQAAMERATLTAIETTINKRIAALTGKAGGV